MANMEERQVELWKRYGKYKRKQSRIVKRYGKCDRKVGWIVNDMENMEEM
jgi:hypothetical protein